MQPSQVIYCYITACDLQAVRAAQQVLALAQLACHLLQSVLHGCSCLASMNSSTHAHVQVRCTFYAMPHLPCKIRDCFMQGGRKGGGVWPPPPHHAGHCKELQEEQYILQ